MMIRDNEATKEESQKTAYRVAKFRGKLPTDDKKEGSSKSMFEHAKINLMDLDEAELKEQELKSLRAKCKQLTEL